MKTLCYDKLLRLTVIVAFISAFIFSTMVAQDSTHAIAKKLRSYIGKKFQSEIHNKTIDVTLEEVTNEYATFVSDEKVGVSMTILQSLECFIGMTTFRFHNSNKEYLKSITFCRADMEAIPWPPLEISKKDQSSLKAAQEGQVSKDALINDLNNIAAHAYQYKIRPKSMAGGQDSYDGYKIPKKLEINENGKYSCMVDGEYLLLMAISSTNSNDIMRVKLAADGSLVDWEYFGAFK